MRCGLGWAVAAHFSSPDMVARGNCSIRGATRRRHAVTGLLVLPNPHLRCLVGRWVRLGEARAVSGGCGAFGRFSRFYLGSSGGCNGGNCSIRGATRRRHAVTGLLVLPNPPICPAWWAVVGVNVAVTATNGCNELVSHLRGGRWRHNPRLATLIGRWPLSPFSQRRGRGRVLPFALGFRGAKTGQIAVGLRHVSRVRFRLSGGRCGGV